MVFSLEVLRARHGDALLLHYGDAQTPRLSLIDGGPGATFGDALQPRLQALRGNQPQLAVDLILVSHLDDDHIGGILGITGDLLQDPQVAPWLTTKAIWCNTFADLADDTDNILATTQAPSQEAGHVVSVGQGRALAAQAEQLGWPINKPFKPLVQAPDKGGSRIPLDGSTDLLVVSPRTDQIAGLRKEWIKQMKRIKKKEASPAEVAAYLDKSPYNLSSIVVLARQGGHSMLLTGDGRGDHILAGLDAAGVTTQGKLHVDILKVPHHGSIRDVDTDFFERITADHYVISANGRDGNPETKTLDMIVASRSDNAFTVHLTYAAGVGDLEQRLKGFVSAQQASRRPFKVAIRNDPALSLTIDLGDSLGI
jgi:hypothetical protein